MSFKRLQELVAAYREGNISDQDLKELNNLLKQKEYPSEWADFIKQTLEEPTMPQPLLRDEEIWMQIESNKKVSPEHRPKLIQWKRISWAAAVILLFVAAGFFLWKPAVKQYEQSVSQQLLKAVEPASQGAVLTLGDGTRVVLDSMGNGLVANQGNTQLLLQDGSLIYTVGKEEQSAIYNTLQTPKGRQFNARLPDGSNVWLNAASSIRYPVAFTENERRVVITGEVYFEIAEDKNKPFFVNVRDVAEVKVTGTHFNVNAYEDEAGIATTLLSGAVSMRSVNAEQQPVLLQPAQQAKLDLASNSLQRIDHIDTSQVMSWKNGMFDFNEASLHQIMRQLSRWYNLTVEYQEGVPDMKFGGMMGRSLKLAEVLELLKGARVNFIMKENRKLIVLPD